MSTVSPTSDTTLALVLDTPLLNLDLLVKDEAGHVLLGLRQDLSCQQLWGVPGGRVYRDETLDQAFARLCCEQIGLSDYPRGASDFLGVYEHFYSDNDLIDSGSAAHHVVLAYALTVDRARLQPKDDRDAAYRWLNPKDAVNHPQVQDCSRAYLDKLLRFPNIGLPSQAPLFDAIRAELDESRSMAAGPVTALPAASGLSNTWTRWFSLALLAALLLALFVGGTHPQAGSLFAPPWDKAAHASMYFTLYLLFRESFSGPSWLLALIVILIGGGDELHQLSLPHRQSDWGDFGADVFGVLLGVVFRKALFVKK